MTARWKRYAPGLYVDDTETFVISDEGTESGRFESSPDGVLP